MTARLPGGLRWAAFAAAFAAATAARAAGPELAPAAFAKASAASLAASDAAEAANEFSIEATVVGGPNLNPNLEGKASPVVVRVFELRQTAAFLAADYAALFEHAQQALGEDLVAQEEFVLRPGEIRHHDRTGGPQASALGLAAGFRTLDEKAWRLIVPLTPNSHNLVLIDLDASRIRVPTLPGASSGR